MCILDGMQSTFFCLGKFLKKLADSQCSSITKGSIYYIKHMYIQPFSMEVDWPEIWCLMEVSTVFYICTYCIFTLRGSVVQKKTTEKWQQMYGALHKSYIGNIINGVKVMLAPLNMTYFKLCSWAMGDEVGTMGSDNKWWWH